MRPHLTGATILAAVTLLSASCSHDSEQNAPADESPSISSPPTSSPSPSPETSIERKSRRDEVAALAAYRAALRESDRIYEAGGRRSLDDLSLVATAGYYKLTELSAQLLRENGWRAVGQTVYVSASASHDGPSKVRVKACEDYTKSRIVDAKGTDHTAPGLRRYVQEYRVLQVGRAWKVASVRTRKVSSFQSYGCGS